MKTLSEEERNIALVVDDTPENLSFITDSLEEAGITVLVARDGKSAIQLVSRITPDIILLDAVMPVMDGFEVCEELKKMQSLSHIPVIFMTGLSDTENIVKGLSAGGVDYLTKPIAPDELIARIGVHLANARLWLRTRNAFDQAGKSLMSVTSSGKLIWASPKAEELLEQGRIMISDTGIITNPQILDWLMLCSKNPLSALHEKELFPDQNSDLRLLFVGRSGRDELLFHISNTQKIPPEQCLQESLNITQREAEVLNWIAQGKSNKDIAEILTLSPRTINKHLEQIYAKLGVENRTSAAATAIRTLAESGV